MSTRLVHLGRTISARLCEYRKGEDTDTMGEERAMATKRREDGEVGRKKRQRGRKRKSSGRHWHEHEHSPIVAPTITKGTTSASDSLSHAQWLFAHMLCVGVEAYARLHTSKEQPTPPPFLAARARAPRIITVPYRAVTRLRSSFLSAAHRKARPPLLDERNKNSHSLLLPSFLAQGSSGTNPTFPIASRRLRPAPRIDVDVDKHTLHSERACLGWTNGFMVMPHIDVDKHTLHNEPFGVDIDKHTLQNEPAWVGWVHVKGRSEENKTQESEEIKKFEGGWQRNRDKESGGTFNVGATARVKQKGKWSSVRKGTSYRIFILHYLLNWIAYRLLDGSTDDEALKFQGGTIPLQTGLELGCRETGTSGKLWQVLGRRESDERRVQLNAAEVGIKIDIT
ncbi:hypothetical protein BDQ17DRAFT_1334966 [Cyathus striatus]|nr:hypothetical protein BDQ17DRAFT_1334966 [Cyathus striatus]